MFKSLYPNFEVDSAYEIDFDALYRKGIKGIIFDIDNTLEEYATKVPGKKVSDFLRKLYDLGFKIGIVSNAKPERVAAFVAGFPKDDYPNVFFVGKAGKPLKRGFAEISDIMGIDLKYLAMVGDQLFTDILGGNRSGCFSILVNPINIKIEPGFVRFKRFFEKPFL